MQLFFTVLARHPPARGFAGDMHALAHHLIYFF
jgi:hypothetical protein